MSATRLLPGERPPGAPVRLAILDDHEVLLDSLRSWIDTHAPDFTVTVTASTWLQLVHSPAFPTDLVLIDNALGLDEERILDRGRPVEVGSVPEEVG